MLIHEKKSYNTVEYKACNIFAIESEINNYKLVKWHIEKVIIIENGI